MTQTIAAASPWPGCRKPLPPMVAIAFKPLHAAIASPVLIFLVALSAMLFRPPDLKTFPLDRVAFLTLVTVFALRLCIRRERLKTFPATWPMLALTLLALWGALGESNQSQVWSLLAAKWIVPFTLFHIAASIFRVQGSLRKLEIFSVAVLCYLALVSVFFMFDAKSLIFPRFILDEGIGIHADRARGPLLQAVANGVCLIILGLVALDSFRRRTIRGILPLLLFFMVPLALLATRTRAVWLAAALSVAYLAVFGSHRRLRRPALALCAIAGIALCGALVYDAHAGALNDRLLDRSPVEFRLEMYETGWQMFTEKPLAGWGSEANVQPEIAKRISAFHPERYLFHNTYLELAVERGMIGLGLYIWLIACLFRLAKRPAGYFNSETHFLDAQFRRLWPVILVVYLLNASAVVMNYQFVNGFLFTTGWNPCGTEREFPAIPVEQSCEVTNMTIAYLANSFPEPLEPYVWEEVCELRKQRVRVLPCSIKQPRSASNAEVSLQTRYAFPLRLRTILQATWVCICQFSRIKEFIRRAVAGPEPLPRRLRTLVHTWLGVYLATMLRKENVRHIHVHHGYFSAWVGMVAARILGASFSMTLHGSDLLVRADYLDSKLKNCRFCVTISDFNQQHILRNYPEVDSRKIFVQRVGINTAEWCHSPAAPNESKTILSVGRLHTVKNHLFLLLACRALKSGGVQFRSSIAGEGTERSKLEKLIAALGLEQEVKLLGHVPRDQLAALYAQADLVVLTSRSEGIPVTLMEAMSMEKLVLAPDITGIAELIKDGKTGFLYQPNSMEDFLHKLHFILHVEGSLSGIRQAARRQVERYFNRSLNLETFAHNFLERLGAIQKPALIPAGRGANEDPVLQQVQLSV